MGLWNKRCIRILRTQGSKRGHTYWGLERNVEKSRRDGEVGIYKEVNGWISWRGSKCAVEKGADCLLVKIQV